MAEIERTRERERGAIPETPYELFIRSRRDFLENLARDWPELMPRYERQYAGRAYLPKRQIEPVRREVADLRHRFGIADRRRIRLEPQAVEPPREDAQATLDDLLVAS